MDESCIFCQVIAGEIPGALVLDEPECLTYLDLNPLIPGHCVLVPRQHYPTLLEAPDKLIGTLFSNAKLIAKAMEEALGAEGTFVGMNNKINQDVPHLHIHIVPRRLKDGLRGFMWRRKPYEDNTEIREVQKKLRIALLKMKNK